MAILVSTQYTALWQYRGAADMLHCKHRMELMQHAGFYVDVCMCKCIYVYTGWISLAKPRGRVVKAA